MDKLQENIVEWTKLDKQLKDINKNACDIRKRKEILQKQIIPIIQINNLEENVFSIPKLKSNITYGEKITYESISYKLLEEKFNEYFNNPQDAVKLLQYIKDNRKKEISYSLKIKEIDNEED
jgi:hypothetical protein